MPAKYKLRKVSDNGPTTCAFFDTHDGCRIGANCKFLHESKPTTNISIPSNSSSSVVSSESSSSICSDGEDAIVEQQVQLTKAQKKQAKQPQKLLMMKQEKTSPDLQQREEQLKKQMKEQEQLLKKIEHEKRLLEQEKHLQEQKRELERLQEDLQRKKDEMGQKQSNTKKVTITEAKKRKSSATPEKRDIFANPKKTKTKVAEASPSQDRVAGPYIKMLENNLPPSDSDNEAYDKEKGLQYLEQVRAFVKTPRTSTPSSKTTTTQRPSTPHNNDSNDEPTSATKTTKQLQSTAHLTREQTATKRFQELDLPIAPFSIPEKNTPSKKNTTPSKKSESDKKVVIPQPLPRKKSKASPYIPLIHATRAHPRYLNSYNLPRFSHGNWIISKPCGPWCANNPHVIAMDCEMCETKDPKSGKVDSSALCRLSVVNALDTSEVLLDTLVKPNWPVTDYRAFINGISATHLKDVKFTLKHAQAFMQAACCDETVIVGHALFNDLISLKMEHYCNVDSSFLFKVKDDKSEDQSSTPSLKDCCTCILKETMPNTHDSVNDALVSLRCCVAYKDENGQVEEVVRTPRTKHQFKRVRTPQKKNTNNKDQKKNTNNEDQKKNTNNEDHGPECLLVHRIPLHCCNESDLMSLFVKHCQETPQKVKRLIRGPSVAKAYVQFRSAEEASQAFEALGNKAELDKAGTMQKKVFLRDSKNYVKVRKVS